MMEQKVTTFDLLAVKDRIFKLITHIPAGKVVTYGHIAKALNIKPAEIVDKVLHGDVSTIGDSPCHRVVSADGSLSETYEHEGKNLQAQKLKQEGVKFSPDSVGKVDLKKSLYVFPYRQF